MPIAMIPISEAKGINSCPNSIKFRKNAATNIIIVLLVRLSLILLNKVERKYPTTRPTISAKIIEIGISINL